MAADEEDDSGEDSGDDSSWLDTVGTYAGKAADLYNKIEPAVTARRTSLFPNYNFGSYKKKPAPKSAPAHRSFWDILMSFFSGRR
jgi:hypothetical protein